MGMLPASSFQDYFATLTDPRCPDAPNSRHQLMDILLIAVCAVICGAEGWEDIEEYGTAHAKWFADILDLPHGIPGHDTFRRVLSRLDPEELTRCFIAWTEALSEASGGDIVSIDGKTLRHSFDRATGQAAIHMVSAWASANRLVLGQLKVEEKSNEITAIPKLLRMVESCREVGEKVQIETRYFLPSLPAQGVRFSQAVRQHWGIENALHWVLDVSFNEDACRIRKDKGAQTFSVLRHIAMKLLRHERRHKRGIKARRKRAGWDQDYLLQVLAG